MFEAAGRTYNLEEVLSAADFRGELTPLWRNWRRSLLRAQVAAARGLMMDQAVVERAVNEFRYARDLITAEECERWLADRGLSAEDLHEHFVRQYWDRALAKAAAQAGDAEGSDSGGGSALFRVDLVLSPECDRMAHALGWRVALRCVEPATGAVVGSGQGPAAAAQGEAAARRVWPLDPGWEAELATMESSFQAHLPRLLTPERRQAWLALRRLDLIRLELETLDFDAEAAAREAYLCVKEDGVRLAEVGEENHYLVQETSALMETFPPEWRRGLLSASCPGVLPPMCHQGVFRVCFLKGRSEPSLEDPTVRERVDADLLRQHFGELEARHLHWHLRVDLAA